MLIQLYSFSKAYRLTGHRVGAICASPARLAEVEKWLDTVAICPPGLGQRAALWGMENLGDWLAAERRDILARRAAMTAGFADLPDWRVLGCGAYFAYVAHPFDRPSDAVAQALVREASLLLLPGTMFGPGVADGGSGRAEATLRIAYANADLAGIGTLFARLADVTAGGSPRGPDPLAPVRPAPYQRAEHAQGSAGWPGNAARGNRTWSSGRYSACSSSRWAGSAPPASAARSPPWRRSATAR